MAGRYHDMYIINLYAPSGTSKKKERVEFYISDLPYLLQHTSHDYIIRGDFNCVLRQTDCIGTPTSKPLEQLIKGCRLIDAWDSNKNQTGYTHYTSNGASRIDRIYMTNTVHKRKIATTTIVAAFTDHNAVKVQRRETRSSPQW